MDHRYPLTLSVPSGGVIASLFPAIFSDSIDVRRVAFAAAILALMILVLNAFRFILSALDNLLFMKALEDLYEGEGGRRSDGQAPN
jgi:hypothetical protein